jgi:hypothetical protein
MFHQISDILVTQFWTPKQLSILLTQKDLTEVELLMVLKRFILVVPKL